VRVSLETIIPVSKLDAIDIYNLEMSVPTSNVPLACAPSQFAALLLAPGFSQVCAVSNVEGMLQYRAESVKGDCGQVLVEAETGNVVGMHVAKERCADKLGLGLPFTPEVLRLLEDFRK